MVCKVKENMKELQLNKKNDQLIDLQFKKLQEDINRFNKLYFWEVKVHDNNFIVNLYYLLEVNI